MGEALLIFLSVLGAFYIDNYREEQNREKQYIQHLTDFRSDLVTNQGKLGFELASPFDSVTNRGYLTKQISQLAVIDSLLRLNPSDSEAILLEMFNNGAIVGLTEWIFTSPQYKKLSSEYYSYLRNDSLRDMLEMHYRNNTGRQGFKGAINDQISKYQIIQDRLNLSDPNDRKNRAILFSNESKNKLSRIRSTYEALKLFTQLNKSNDSLLLIQVEKELADWGE